MSQFQNIAPPVDRSKTIAQLKSNLKHLFEAAKLLNEKIKEIEAEEAKNVRT